MIFRRFKDQDLELFKQWLEEPYIAKWYLEPEDWIDEVEKRNDEFHW